METLWQQYKDDPEFTTMTVLAGAGALEDLDDWLGLGATYTVLWDEGNAVTGTYGVTNRPMFVVVDRDMTILLRESNEEGHAAAEELVHSLL